MLKGLCALFCVDPVGTAGSPSLNPAAPWTPAGEAGPLGVPLLLKAPPARLCHTQPGAPSGEPGLEEPAPCPGKRHGVSDLRRATRRSSRFPFHPRSPRYLGWLCASRTGLGRRLGVLHPCCVCSLQLSARLHPPLPARVPGPRGSGSPPGACGSLAPFPGIPHRQERQGLPV